MREFHSVLTLLSMPGVTRGQRSLNITRDPETSPWIGRIVGIKRDLPCQVNFDQNSAIHEDM